MFRARSVLPVLSRTLPSIAPSTAAVARHLLRPTFNFQPAAASNFGTSASLFKVAERHISPKFERGDVVTYSELKPITKNPTDDILLIDVREPDEVVLGNIPSSVNIPLSNFEKSLSMDEGDFTKTHSFHKPTKRQQIIFYCRSGKRSATAMDLAKRAGYKGIRNYEGSYLDWQAKESSSNHDY